MEIISEVSFYVEVSFIMMFKVRWKLAVGICKKQLHEQLSWSAVIAET